MSEQFGSFFSESSCSYLPSEQSRTEYRFVTSLTAQEYGELIHQGWRRFGHLLFRPQCVACHACHSLRVAVAEFQPNRSQKRNIRANAGVAVLIGSPQFDEQRMRLYGEFHDARSEQRGWARESGSDFEHYLESFMVGPLPIMEFSYWEGERLLGVGFFEEVPDGLSAIYCFYSPEAQARGIGTLNVLTGIEETRRRGLMFLHLGYYVRGCLSLEYKANFKPNQLLNHQTLRWE